MNAKETIQRLKAVQPVVHSGRLSRIMPTWLEADGPNLAVGSLCRISGGSGLDGPLAEVVRVDGSGIAMVPLSQVTGFAVGDRVEAVADGGDLPVGMEFLGRAIDALGNPIDGGPPIFADAKHALNPDPPAPLDRVSSDEILATGVRAIDGIHPLTKGQRIGVFAASGVGKTSLLSQLLRQVETDICICCLVGERGREVESIWSRELSGETRQRSVMVAATSDNAAALRIRAVYQAIALARFYRDAGRHVLLVIDSVTRFAMALRELGLAAGEPPTLRAYTPNVFSIIPRIVEQAGALKDSGSISAVMTILSENDDVDDPLCELMKSLLDGHIILSRTLAERGHFPAIDPLKSVSRNAHLAMSSKHLRAAREAQSMLESLERSRTMIDTGLYSAGSNPGLDTAIAAQSKLEAFLQQQSGESSEIDKTIALLQDAVSGAYATA